MKRFSFRLSSLLDFREHLERLARKETAMAYKDVKESQDAIEELRGEYIKTAEELDSKVSKRIKAEQLQLYTQYLELVDYSIFEEKQREKVFQQKLEKKIAELTKKSVDKKVIEQLKEKKELEYMEEFRKFEQETIDEVVSLKKARELNYEASSKN